MSNLTLEDAIASFPVEENTTDGTPPSLDDAIASFSEEAPVSLEEAIAGFQDEEGGLRSGDASTAGVWPPGTRSPALTPDYYIKSEPGLGQPISSTVHAAALGGISAVHETTDFARELFGGEATERPEFDAEVKKAKEGGIVDGLALGIGQFAVAMIGAGKLIAIGKAAPIIGGALETAGAAITATRTGRFAAEAAKLGAVSAVAFDPHEERLSNLLQDSVIGNPLFDYLAADPDDSATEGRWKAFLESTFLDATLAVPMALTVGAKIMRAKLQGDTDGMARLAQEGQAEITKAAQAGEMPTPAASVADDLAPKPADNLAVVKEDGGLPSPASADAAAEKPLADSAKPITRAAETPAVQGPDALPASRFDLLPKATLADEDTAGLLDAMRSDADAIAKHGSRQDAMNKGLHSFGQGASIPYAKLTDAEEVNAFLARVVDAEEERIVAAKGGAVLHDDEVERIALDRAKLFGEDPATFIGNITRSAEASVKMVADAEAGRLIVSRLADDLTAFAQKLQVGDFSMIGGDRAAAYAEFARRHAMLSSVHAATSAITSNSARATRLAGVRLAIDPVAVAAIPVQDTERLIALYAASDGTPQSVRRLADPGLLAKGLDAARFVFMNALLSGWPTHVANALGSGYMIGVRPLERMLGASARAAIGGEGSGAIVRHALRQYAYTTTAFVDGFMSAVQALKMRDSVLAPHTTEVQRALQGPSQTIPSQAWRPWTTPANVLHNVFASIVPNAALATIGAPTHLLAFADEMTKQTVGRSYVMAEAHLAGAEEASRLGLEGGEARSFVKDYVRQRLDAAFDGSGRMIHERGRTEAEIATFSQDLPKDAHVGRAASKLKQALPALGFVLPFVKTPTHILRYGWKMTPVLNLAQGEYRAMLKGEMGAEAQAQAMGQVAIGTSGLLAAASLASMGIITGGGPQDPKQRQALLATGWQPYSVVRQNDDGTRSYFSFGRLDPIAIPFGMVADIQDAMAAMGRDEDLEGREIEEKLAPALLALGIATTKQFTSKSYLKGFSDFLAMVQDPDQRAGPYWGNMVSNFIPLAAGLRRADPDPYMREAQGVMDRIKDTIPGLGAGLSPRYDAFGDPVLARNGLWSSDTASTVDREMQRLALENGAAPTRVSPAREAGVDLRDITMADGEYAGRNAYEVYQELGGHLPGRAPSLKDVVAKLIESRGYERAPDGDAGTPGTKLNMVTGLIAKYRADAMGILKRDQAVRTAMGRRREKVKEAYRLGAAGSGQSDKLSGGRPTIGEAFGQALGGLFDGGGGQ